ncbi:hypothetical protein GCM10023238_38720 [Streptomyces heliomycini]
MRTPPARGNPPRLDAAQRSVVEHGTGPLLVLAGPGTGKTTTLVESVAARIARGGDPERILVLTFSRKAAVELRDRMALRIGAARAPQATTFHSFCYALIRAHQDSDLFVEPLRLLSGPEQDVTVRELLAGQVDLERLGLAHVRWPDELRACLTTRGFADEVRAVLARSRELGLGPEALDAFARRIGRPDWRAASAFLAEYLDVLDLQGVLDYAELVHRAVLLAGRPEIAGQLAARYDAVYVDEYQDTDPAQVRLLHALAGGRTLVAFGDPDQSIYAFRGADVGGHPGVPVRLPPGGRPPRPGRGAAHLPALRRRPAGGHPAGDPAHAAAPPARREGPRPPGADRRPGRRPGRGVHLPDVRHGTGQHRRHPAPGAPGGRPFPGTTWPSWSGPEPAPFPPSAARSPRRASPWTSTATTCPCATNRRWPRC